jgi:hypothetical protein
MKLVFSDKRNATASATSQGLAVRPRRWSGFATLSILARAPLGLIREKIGSSGTTATDPAPVRRD